MLYPVRRFSIHYLLLLTIALLALSLGTPAMAAKKESKAKKPKLDSKTVKYEIQYLKKSIDKHAKIIQKLKDIDTLTTNVQVIAFVNIFIPAEEAEMVTMKAMLSNWYQIIYNPKPRLDDEDEEEAPDDIEIIGSMIGYANSEIAWAKQVPPRQNKIVRRHQPRFGWRFAPGAWRNPNILLYVLSAIWLDTLGGRQFLFVFFFAPGFLQKPIPA